MHSAIQPVALRPAPVLILVSLLFLLSGATGLAYEVIWFRQFSDIWGGSSAAMAAVVASFLFGLGLGARLFGARADRSASPLLVYALCELGIGLLAMAIPFELAALPAISSALFVAFEAQPLSLAFARFGVTLAILGPPTVLMGATLPLLVRQFALTGRGLASSTAWLYFLNSLGAAVGAWMVGFWLLPTFGLVASNRIVISLNLLIALLAWALVREVQALVASSDPPTSIQNEVESPSTDTGHGRIPGGVVAAAFLSGFAAIALQMVWVRQMSLTVGGTTYAFTAVLTVFILGLACGSLVFRFCVRETSDLEAVFARCSIGLVLTSLCGWAALPRLGEIVGDLGRLRAEPGFNAMLCLVAAAAIEALPTFFMGLLFPTLIALSGSGADRAGRTVGQLYAWNTGGAILAATLTAAVLFPTLGGFGILISMSLLYGAAVICVLGSALRRREPTAWVALATLFVITGVGALVCWPDVRDTQRRNMGSYLYSGMAFRSVEANSEVVFYREAPTCNVMVMAVEGQAPGETNERLLTLRVNGKVDGGNFSDLNTQLACAYFPRLLRPDARETLVIGFGTGTTAGASCLFPDSRVDCCEIEPAIVEASPIFHETNHRPELQPNYRTIPGDGRNYLLATDRRYDLVISEPSNPWISGISRLYTREFYAGVRGHLNSGGMLAQWIQTYQIGRAEFSLIINTIHDVFPHTALIRIVDGDVLLLASEVPIVPTREGIERAQRQVDGSETIRTELARRFGSADVRSLLLGHLLLDRRGLEGIVLEAGQAGINTDQNMRLEFDAPLRLFDKPFDAEIGAQESMLHAADAGMVNELISSWGWTGEQQVALEALRSYYFRSEHTAMAVDISNIALAYVDSPLFLADQLIYAPPSDLLELRIGVKRVLETSRPEARRIALTLGQLGDAQRSAAAYEELRLAYPDSATLCASLAVVYAELGRGEAAEAMLQRALELDPLSEATMMVEASQRADR